MDNERIQSSYQLQVRDQQIRSLKAELKEAKKVAPKSADLVVPDSDPYLEIKKRHEQEIQKLKLQMSQKDQEVEGVVQKMQSKYAKKCERLEDEIKDLKGRNQALVADNLRITSEMHGKELERGETLTRSAKEVTVDEYLLATKEEEIDMLWTVVKQQAKGQPVNYEKLMLSVGGKGNMF